MVKDAGMTMRNRRDGGGLAGVLIMDCNGLILIQIIANNALS